MTPGGKQVLMVAAVARNGVIGNAGKIPWDLPEDVAHFRRVTDGHIVVMGRATYDSMGRPLPRRTNVVVTRQPGWTADGVLVAATVEDALALCDEHEGDAIIMGGGQIYTAALPYAEQQVISEVHGSFDGDAHYPDFDRSEWSEHRRERHEGFDIVWWQRRH